MQNDTNTLPRVINRSQKSRGLSGSAMVFAAATAIGLFFTAQIYFTAASLGRSVSWGQALYWALGDWYEWALLAPLVFWLCRTFRFDRQIWPKNLGIHAVAGFFLAAVHAVLCALAARFQGWVTHQPVFFGSALRALLANRLHYNFAVYWVIVFAWQARNYHRSLRESEQESAELSARLALAQLQTLRMQLNPHFLFNTLNAVSSMMLTDVPRANAMLARLAELLRLALNNPRQAEVPLHQEIDFLSRYLDLQKIRFGDRLILEMAVDPATLQAAVPNMILQPIVENAIRHAVEHRESDGRIELRATAENSRLVLSVSDNGPGAPINRTRVPIDGESEHIGLSNSRERLHKLYGEEQSMDLVENAMGGITARLSLPFRPIPSLSA